MLLALDSSTAIASVALYDGKVAGEITWYSGRNHSVELIPQALSLLDLRRVRASDLVAIAAATGPGSYTGLRVGLAAAKGLCLALEIPMIGISSLDVLAEPHSGSCLPVRPILDAGRKRYATALYKQSDGRLVRTGPIEGRRMSEILADLAEQTLLCGDLDECRESDVPSAARLASPASSLRRAGFLAEIAWREYQAGRYQDPGQVEAFYLAAGSQVEVHDHSR